MSGQIVDTTLVLAIKQGKTADEIWPDEPNKSIQTFKKTPSNN